MHSGLRTILVLASLSLFGGVIVPVLMGQERFGEITGVASDPSGAVLPNTKVTITNKSNQRVFTTNTGGDGAYVARDLEPGHYSVRFESTGFNPVEVPDVNLLVGKTLKVDAGMQLSSAQTTVQVSEESPLIDISSAAVTHNITAEEFDRMPKARSFQSLATTSPSVNAGEVEGGIQVNGASGSENQFVIDGISTNSLVDGRSRQNAVFEFLEDVDVKTGGISAEYGGALGGVISAVTKSGGNQFHGDVHYYYYGNAISSGPVRRLLLNPINESAVSFVQDHKNQTDNHEAGYALGGPIFKNKLYFFSSASPRWVRRSNDYLFTEGAQGAIDQKQLYMQLFNKVTWDVGHRVRANFAWLYTPTYSTGRLPAYDFEGNGLSSSLASNVINRGIGYNQPQSSYTGQIDFTATPTLIFSLRGGYFWDNYKDTGIPGISSVVYQTSATNLPFDIPANLRQPVLFQNTPRLQNNFHDLTSRAYVQLDGSKYGRFLGYHNVTIGGGVQKTVNNVDVGYPGGGYVYVYWDRAFTSNATNQTQRGQYGYYEVDDIGTRGSTGGTITNLFVQDNWRIIPRLTLNLGLRSEKETIPSFRRDIRDYSFKFKFQDKMAPRLGASFDVFGNGRLKVYGSWGRFYDWVKYELSRGTFGGDFWTVRYRALDTTDVFSLSGTNAPGKNIWSDVPGSFRDRRVPGFNNVDPNIKPMYTDLTNVGVEFQLTPTTVARASYVRNSLGRTIEDLGVLVNGDEVYQYANPGEGGATVTPTSGKTQPFATPKPVRTYNAMELSLNRRFSRGWFGSFSYVYSRLYGNYAGLGSSDEIRTPTTNVTSATSQQQGGSIARPGSSATRSWDIDEILWDSHGKLDVLGRLATDRPHAFKLYGSYLFKFGTELGLNFYGASGTPISTYVNTVNQIPVFVNGRGDMTRTPVLTQTDLLLAHEFRFTEAKRLRFEFNALNLFNQKTSRHRFNNLNRGAGAPRQSSAINLSGVDLAKGYDYNALIRQSPEGAFAYDPRYGLDDLFNPGFSGRLGLKFIF